MLMDNENESNVKLALDSEFEEDVFEEILIFNHTWLTSRKCQIENIETEEFPYLINMEFNFGKNALNNPLLLKNQETIQDMIRNKFDFFLTTDETEYKVTILENLHLFANELGRDKTIDLIVPFIKEITTEKDQQIKLKYFSISHKHIKDILLSYGDLGYNSIITQLIPTYFMFFNEKSSIKMIEVAIEGIIDISKHLKKEDITEKVLTQAIIISNIDTNDEFKIQSIKIFYEISLILGRELTERYIVPQLFCLSEDIEFRVRKELMSPIFINVCNVVSQSCFKNKLLPLYLKLAKDNMWLVKRSTVEILPLVCKICDEDIKVNVMLELYKDFTKVSSKWVRLATIQIIGKLVANYTNKDLSRYILDYFIRIVNDYYDLKIEELIELDFIFHCAYNFPAILLSYGKESWDYLKRPYYKLCNDKENNIRKIMAASFGDVSNILKEEIVQRDMIVIFNKFYEDDFNIKSCIVNNLPLFLKNLKVEDRDDFYYKMKIYIDIYGKTWRQKLESAQLLFKFYDVFDNDFTYQLIIPTCISLCVDNVAEVREYACQRISKFFLQFFSRIDCYKVKIAKVIECFALSYNFRFREMFILMCFKMAKYETFFKSYFLEYIVNLVNDKVVGVRIRLAQFISHQFLKKKTWILHNPVFRKLAYILKNDSNVNVGKYFTSLDIQDENQVKIETQPSNAIFTCNMEFLKDEFGIMVNNFNYFYKPNNNI